jgi:hypothetical protein
MNKNYLYRILRIICKGIIFTLRFALTVFFSDDLDKRIKKLRKNESEYDELTKDVVNKKHLQ